MNYFKYFKHITQVCLQKSVCFPAGLCHLRRPYELHLRVSSWFLADPP